MRVADMLSVIVIVMAMTVDADELKDGCRDVTLKQPIKDKALAGHVIAIKTVTHKKMCDILCYREPNCVSTNFHTEPGKTENCELNSSDEERHPEDLTDKAEVIYQAFKNFCNNRSCPTEKMTCQSGYGNEGYRCVCPKCFQGDLCQKAMEDIVLHFPEKSIENVVAIENPFPKLIAFTVAMWVQVDTERFYHVPFAYATKTVQDAIAVFIYSTSLKLKIRNEWRLDVRYPFTDHTGWQHICLTWENTNGVLIAYINGVKYGQATDVFKGYTIPQQGALTLGQEQDSCLGRYDRFQALKGNLTSVNVWDSVLNASEVADRASKCPSREGNVFKWSDAFRHKSDSVGYFCGTDCRT